MRGIFAIVALITAGCAGDAPRSGQHRDAAVSLDDTGKSAYDAGPNFPTDSASGSEKGPGPQGDSGAVQSDLAQADQGVASDLARPDAAGPRLAAYAVDVHVHTVSATLRAAMPAIKPHLAQLSGPTLLAWMDRAKLSYAVVLSGGYLLSASARVGALVTLAADGSSVTLSKQRSLVAQENQYLANVVSHDTSRLIGFCAVPLDEDWVLEQMSLCRQLGLRGLKLLIQPVSLQDVSGSAAASQLRAILKRAADYRWPVLIHPGFAGLPNPTATRNALLALIQEPGSPRVILAHNALLADRKSGDGLYTDISLLSSSASSAQRKAIVAHWRRTGIDKVLFATDWIGASAPQRQPEIMRSTLLKMHQSQIGQGGLTDQETKMILHDNAKALLGI
ncbi:MAG: amidohydrolase family protein [Deltaproteobacteria bacterium]|nr:amidohydrolase family protein [Deltaproteobacteria bacterium]